MAYGLAMVFKGPLIHLFPRQWNSLNWRSRTPRDSQDGCGLGLAGLLLVALTWYLYLTTQVRYSIIVTLVLTLTLIKLYQVLFRYQRFRDFAVQVTTNDRRSIAAMNIVTAVGGILLILLGLFVY